MTTRLSPYRSTLVAAAVAIGCLGTAAAEAHEHGWRGHDGERGWYGREHEWREHEWREHGWYRHDYPRPYYYGAPVVAGGWVAPLPPPLPLVGPGGVSLTVRFPF
ncbi:MAG: hypothetical protein JSR54_08315 [Proteobacteria bacterium]|nr:hypothetical protein [Pseudomonadota bacterium]